MTEIELSDRCRRELNNSRNEMMLTVAWKYYELYEKYLLRLGHSEDYCKMVRKSMQVVYKRQKERFK